MGSVSAQSLLENVDLIDVINVHPNDRSETIDAHLKFFDAYRAKSKPVGTLPLFHVLKRHNHISNVLSIGTEDTSQSEPLLAFIQSCVNNQGFS